MKLFILRFLHFICNSFVFYVPMHDFRNMFLRLCGSKIGHSRIDMYCIIRRMGHLTIGNYTHVNKFCILDAGSDLVIGNNVSISYRVSLLTGDHDMNSPTFAYRGGRIIIEDNVWIGCNAVVLPGVKIGKGAVVASGSVVTKDVSECSVVAGIPAKEIGKRQNKFHYKCYDNVGLNRFWFS